jgi:hypothetical protein
MPDHIDHPVHYTQGIECIDYIKSHKMNYMEGNIIKYVTRYKFKGGVDDLRKAEWYLKKLMETIALDNSWPSVEECSKPLYLAEDMVAEDGNGWDVKEYEKEKEREMAQETLQAMQEARRAAGRGEDIICSSGTCDNYIKPHFPGVRF